MTIKCPTKEFMSLVVRELVPPKKQIFVTGLWISFQNYHGHKAVKCTRILISTGTTVSQKIIWFWRCQIGNVFPCSLDVE
jgi:hypothetical protein